MTKRIPLKKVKLVTYNPRVPLTPEDQEWKDIEASLNEFGYLGGMVVNTRTMNLVAGHQRLAILRARGETAVEFATVDLNDDDERRLNIVMNRVTGRWDDTKLATLLAELQGKALDISTLGFSQEAIDALLNPGSGAQSGSGKLAERFLVPPFSVLNAREGWWQERKSAWIALGIKSELGRGASPGDSPRPAADYSNKERGDGAGKPIRGGGGNATPRSSTKRL